MPRPATDTFLAAGLAAELRQVAKAARPMEWADIKRWADGFAECAAQIRALTADLRCHAEALEQMREDEMPTDPQARAAVAALPEMWRNGR